MQHVKHFTRYVSYPLWHYFDLHSVTPTATVISSNQVSSTRHMTTSTTSSKAPSPTSYPDFLTYKGPNIYLKIHDFAITFSEFALILTLCTCIVFFSSACHSNDSHLMLILLNVIKSRETNVWPNHSCCVFLALSSDDHLPGAQQDNSL